ncbi:MAG: hypothetical protein K5978_01470 [Campylobacter sp.]|nr:hypothetical protein [Campylobacter sp.]
MKGKILGLGAISGNDGVRYKFGLEDIENLGDLKPEDLSNKEVDFAPEGTKATKIFITCKQNDFSKALDNISFDLTQDNVSSIKNLYLISIVLFIFCNIAPFGLLFDVEPTVFSFISFNLFFVALILSVWAIRSLSKAIQSKTLFNNFIWMMIFPFFSIVIIIIAGFIAGFAGAGLGTLGSSEGSIGVGAIIGGAIIGGVIGTIITGVGTWIFAGKFYKEMELITQQSLFKYVFWFKLIGFVTLFIGLGGVGFVLAFFIGVGFVTLFIGVGFVLVFVAEILEIIAWIKIEKIYKVEKK